MKKYIFFLAIILFLISGCGGGGDGDSSNKKKEDKSWHSAKMVFDNVGADTTLVTDKNEKGDIIALWFAKKANNKYAIAGAMYDSSTKNWQNLGIITPSEDIKTNKGISVDINEDGNVIIAALDESEKNIYAYYYDKDTNQWKKKNVDNLNKNIRSYKIALAKEKGFVAWIQDDGSAYSLYASVYTISSNIWSIPSRKEGATNDVGLVNLTSYGDDKAMLTWRDFSSRIWYRVYDNGWKTITRLIDTTTNKSAINQMQNNNGDGVLGWLESPSIGSYDNYIYFFNEDTWIEQSSDLGYDETLLDYTLNGDVLIGNYNRVKIYNHTTDSWSDFINFENQEKPYNAALDLNLNIFHTWIKDDGTGSKELYGRVYSKADESFKLTAILSKAKNITGGQILINKNNEAKIVWLQTNSSNIVSLYEANYK